MSLTEILAEIPKLSFAERQKFFFFYNFFFFFFFYFFFYL